MKPLRIIRLYKEGETVDVAIFEAAAGIKWCKQHHIGEVMSNNAYKSMIQREGYMDSNVGTILVRVDEVMFPTIERIGVVVAPGEMFKEM